MRLKQFSREKNNLQAFSEAILLFTSESKNIVKYVQQL